MSARVFGRGAHDLIAYARASRTCPSQTTAQAQDSPQPAPSYIALTELYPARSFHRTLSIDRSRLPEKWTAMATAASPRSAVSVMGCPDQATSDAIDVVDGATRRPLAALAATSELQL
ncbi:hypothetical protein BV20DRAFT_17340 [Pilatotrama ljubarskyi]|nr:hypothetical protein BV20DRAFT_17340 [Pilatotrama ljubarskyi]